MSQVQLPVMLDLNCCLQYRTAQLDVAVVGILKMANSIMENCIVHIVYGLLSSRQINLPSYITPQKKWGSYSTQNRKPIRDEMKMH